MKRDALSLTSKKHHGQKISMLTCYDYPTARLEDQAGIDVLLVGDSVGTNVLGYASEREVTMSDMVHHLKAVRRGVQNAFVLVDFPYASYENEDDALRNAQTLIGNGADGVKLEGPHPEIIRHLTQRGIAVCGHLGFTPQTIDRPAVQGKTFEQARQLLESSSELERAGAFMLVLELVPEEVADFITKRLSMLTIGIASGRHTDGQVLIIQDLLGVTERKMRHTARYQEFRTLTTEAIQRYRNEVEGGQFPEYINSSHMKSEEFQQLNEWLTESAT